MEAGTRGKRISSKAAPALPAAALDCSLLPCPVVSQQEPRETGPIPQPLSADLVVHSPETATGSARQNKLKRWRKPGGQAPLSPNPGPCRTKHDGARGQSVSRHQSARPEAQEVQNLPPKCRSGLPVGRRRPQSPPQNPKAGHFGGKMDSIKWIFSQIGRLVDQNWQALEPCPLIPSLTSVPVTYT